MDAADLVASAGTGGRLAASRAARAPCVRGVERARRRRPRRACRDDGPGRPPAGARRPGSRSGSSTPAAASASRTSRTRRRSTSSRLGAGLAEIIAGWAADPLLRDARLLLEPGRFLVGPAGAYLARVVDRKTVDGSIVVILDGGVHHVLRPALVGQEHRIRAFGDRGTRSGSRRRSDGPGHRRRAAVLGARCLQPGAR